MHASKICMHAYDPATHMIDGLGIGRSSTSHGFLHCLPCMGVDMCGCYLSRVVIHSILIDDSATVSISYGHTHACIVRRKGEKISNVCTVHFNN